jgi:hypothetical protein
MSKNAKWVRTGSMAALIAVPTLAVAFLFTAGASVPSFQVKETREFNHAGQNIGVQTQTKDAVEQVDVFLGEWQNTVRTSPTPRV